MEILRESYWAKEHHNNGTSTYQPAIANLGLFTGLLPALPLWSELDNRNPVLSPVLIGSRRKAIRVAKKDYKDGIRTL